MGARLTSEERDILARAFGAGSTAVYVDGWTSERGRAALNKAAHLGLAKASVNRGWQYTTITYEPTDAGREYLGRHVLRGDFEAFALPAAPEPQA